MTKKAVSQPRFRDGAKPALHPAFDRGDQFERRRQAMVETAIRAFNRHGFHATSMDAIAAELGLTKGTLYHYFESKTELLYACCLQAAADGLSMAEQAESGGGTGIEKLERFLRLQFGTLAGSSGSAWPTMNDISALPPPQQAELRKRSRVVDGKVQRMIAEGIGDGSIEATEPKIAEFFLIGALNWLPRWYSPDGPLSSEALAGIFIRLVLDGMRPRR